MSLKFTNATNCVIACIQYYDQAKGAEQQTTGLKGPTSNLSSRFQLNQLFVPLMVTLAENVAQPKSIQYT